MIIEKIKDNKFRVSFSITDLEEENIDFHVFMSTNIKNHIFMKKLLFKLQTDYDITLNENNILIDLFLIDNQNFIMIIYNLSKNSHSKVIAKRQTFSQNFEFNIYSFNSLIEIKNFFCFLNNNFSLCYNLLENSPIYKYDNLYFLIINQNGISEIIYSSIDKYLSEFSIRINNPKNFYVKLVEYGDIIN